MLITMGSIYLINDDISDYFRPSVYTETYDLAQIQPHIRCVVTLLHSTCSECCELKSLISSGLVDILFSCMVKNLASPDTALLTSNRSRTGRKGPYAHYYLQIQPGGSFIGGGIWHPDAPPLSLLRQDVDRKPHKLKKVLLDPNIRKEFLKGAPNDEKKAVKGFVGQNAENMLKTKPKVSIPSPALKALSTNMF